jgi:NTP pyrophosphatase (non-canonical NTP hydrolase)
VGRIVLLVTSPRLPDGLLTAAAWDLVRAQPVLAGTENGQVAALRANGAQVEVAAPAQARGVLLERGAAGTVVWLAGPTGDPELARELGLRLAREPALAELEVVYGSWDPPGARLLDVVAAIDRLASPGGDPWKHQQTHASLARYLLEEAYEAYDAIQADDSSALREELGDVLLQVVLHARMAQDDRPSWSIDELAGVLVQKMVRRNPHVFAGVPVGGIDEIMANWERIKREEKAGTSALDGIALSQPALALATKVLGRASRIDPERGASVEPTDGPPRDESELAARLLALVAIAQARGWDAEGALRRAALAELDVLRTIERAGPVADAPGP